MYKLKYVTKDITKDLDYVDLVGIQMDVSPAVDEAKKMDRIPKDMDLLDWKTAVSNPMKYKGFFTTFFECLFLGKHNRYEINIDGQLDSQNLSQNERRIAMLWLPYTTKKENIIKVGNIVQEIIGGSYHIIVLTSKTTTNRKAEDYVKKEIAKTTKPVLIISAIIGMRSFSEGGIYEVYLAYDRGSDGSNTQKFSRALTTDKTNKDKKAIIVSLSFDPNRDDKFDKYILESAERLCKRNGGTIQQNIKIVSNAFNIFSCTTNGAIRLLVDDFVTQSMNRGSASKVFANKVDLINMPMDIKLQLADIANIGNTKKNVIKTKLTKPTKNSLAKISQKVGNGGDLNSKVREACFQLIENSKILVGAGKNLGANGILECFDKFETMENSTKMIADITNTFELDYYIIKECIINGWIKAEWIDFKNNKILSK
jgi:hypothetical protein